MKTTKIHGLKLNNPARNTRKLINSQTKLANQLNAPLPVVQKPVEPAVFDINYLKNVWEKLVKFFK